MRVLCLALLLLTASCDAVLGEVKSECQDGIAMYWDEVQAFIEELEDTIADLRKQLDDALDNFNSALDTLEEWETLAHALLDEAGCEVLPDDTIDCSAGREAIEESVMTRLGCTPAPETAFGWTCPSDSPVCG